MADLAGCEPGSSEIENSTKGGRFLDILILNQYYNIYKGGLGKSEEKLSSNECAFQIKESHLARAYEITLYTTCVFVGIARMWQNNKNTSFWNEALPARKAYISRLHWWESLSGFRNMRLLEMCRTRGCMGLYTTSAFMGKLHSTATDAAERPQASVERPVLG